MGLVAWVPSWAAAERMHRLVIALTALIGLVGAAFLGAYFLFFSASTDRAASLAPADTAVYVNVYLQPSAAQQMNLSSLIGRLPGFADTATLDEKIDQLVQNLLADSGIDYLEEIKPWLGNQVAIAAVPGADDVLDADVVLLLAVKDRPAAEAALEDVSAANALVFETRAYGGVDLQVAESTTYAFVEEMLVVSDAAVPVEATIDVAAGAPSLADEENFRRATTSLPADHLASVFVDLAGVAEATGGAAELQGYSVASAVLVAEAEGLRLSGSAPFDAAAPGSPAALPPESSEPAVLVEWMPAGTQAGLVIFDLRQVLEDAEAAVAVTPEAAEVMSALDTIRAVAALGLGIDLDVDILPLLDHEVALAFGGIDGDLPSGQLLLRPTEAAASEEAIGRVLARLEETGASVRTEDGGAAEITVVSLDGLGEIALATIEGIIVFGIGADDVQAALEAHDSGATLAASDAYRRAFDLAGTRAGNELFVNVPAVADALGASDDLSPDGRDILQQIEAFAFTTPSRNDRIEFHAVLTLR
ncbi:MAG: DUF3352 domain-containing protein [Candidatus Limnocylindria bacterium]